MITGLSGSEGLDRLRAEIDGAWRWGPCTRSVAFVALYAAMVVLGRATRLDGTQLALVWPAAGVAFLWLAASWGHRRQRRVDLVLLFAVTVVSNLATGAPGPLSLGFGAANTAQAVVACAVFARLRPGPWRLRDAGDLRALIAASAAGSVASAGIGPLAVWLTTASAWPVDSAAWVLRNGTSTFVVATVGLRLFEPLQRHSPFRAPHGWEFLAVNLAAFAAYTLVFGFTTGLPVAFLVLPLIVWVALRFDTTLAAVHGLVTGALLVTLTLEGHGPFAVQPPVTRVMLAQAFIAVASVSALILALYRDERHQLLDARARTGRELADARDAALAAQAATAAGEERLRFLVENLQEVVFQTDADRRWTFLNPAWEDVTGSPVADALGRDLLEFVHPDDRDRARERFAALLRQEQEHHRHETRYLVAGGSYRWVEVVARPTVVEGRVVGTTGALLDVTDRHAVETELARARDEALDAARAKSAFLANMSHEIRTPMNGVIGLTEVLLDTDLTDDQRRLASTLRTSGHALLTIINDILDFSKAEAGGLELERVPFDVRVPVEASMSLVSEPARSKGLMLDSFVEDDVPARVLGDPLRLQQILTNFLSNAVKFTSHGSVILHVRGLGDGRVRFEVRDTGIGIEPAALGRLFDPFAQADASTTRSYGGTGLGLSICRQLVELMGGEVGVTSEPGAGSVFWCALRLEPTAETAPALTAASAPAHAAVSPGARVLVVEDNAVNQAVAVQMLAKRGYVVDVANDGGEALDAVAKTPYALVLMDCQMPRVDGYTATRRIRALEGDGRRMPIVAMTASTLQEDREACTRAGMDDHLPKPFTGAALQAVLERWLSPADSACLDPEVLRSMRLGVDDADFVREVARLFADESAARLAACRRALAESDGDALQRAAHAQKGSGGALGATRVQALSATLETLGRNEDFRTATAVLTELESAVAATTVALTQE